MTLLEQDFVVGNSHLCQSRPALYFLVRGDRVVYVGSSRKNIHARIGYHVGHKSKPFDRYYAVYCDLKDLEATEAAYIEAFKPIYNNAGNKRYSADKHCAAILATAASS